MKFRKKPVVIEAFNYDGDLISSDGSFYVPLWAEEAYRKGEFVYRECGESPAELFIQTLEGEMHVAVGDWIIKGIKGEIYPCKPDIFEATYEPVDSTLEKEGVKP